MVSVFGLAGKLSAATSAVSLAGVMSFTVIFEMLTHRLESKVNGTPFMGMVSKIYKELMIMGVISFSVTMLENSGFLSVGDSFYAFEVRWPVRHSK